MKLTLWQEKTLLEAAKPLMRWMAENTHPHCTVIVDSSNAELMEGVFRTGTDEFIETIRRKVTP